MQNEKFIISVYPDKKSLNKMSEVPLEWFIRTDYFKDIVDNVRKYEYHSQEYIDAKDYAPIATINGIVKRGLSKTKENIIINPTICIDIDRQDNIDLFTRNSIDEIKYMISSIPSCMYVYKSIGGYGLSCIHRLSDNVNKENYIEYFKELQEIYKQNGFIIDKSCSNVNRLRYCSYDDFVIKNEIYTPYELQGIFENEKKEKIKIDRQYTNININVENKEYNLDNSKGPFYFGHSDYHDNTPLIQEVIHTLLCFFSKEETKEIWKHEKFYRQGNNKWKIPYDILRWIDAFPIRDKMIPSKTVIEFLNNNCGFNLKVNIKKKGTEILDNIPGEMINDFFLVKHDIFLNDNEFLYDKKEEIKDNIKEGINLIISGTGTGKTTFWNKIYNEEKSTICVVEPYTSVVENKYDKNITHIAAGKGKYIDPTKEYIATNYLKFIKCVKQDKIPRYDYLVLDESHLIGTQPYRSESLIEFVECVKIYNNKYPTSKIILQTATPSNEEFFFDIYNKIIINKKEDKLVQIHYTCNYIMKTNKILKDADEYYQDNIKTILYYTDIYLNEGRKVYIYWGSGGITDMKDIQKLQNMLSDKKCAVFHKKNDMDDSMKYIMDNHKMGEYDILISSCYFSVGCDLDDFQNAAIIIVGNNPYYEDEQVIGRFRNSKNIKVNILIDKNCYIKKKDTSMLLELTSMRGNRINISKKSRDKSIIRKYSDDDTLESKAYIQCSNIYFSDLKRKFEFYNTKKNYNIVNKINIYKEDKDIYYDILDITENGYMTVCNYIEYDDKDYKGIIKDRNNLIKNLKEEIYLKIIQDNYYDLEGLFESSKEKPSFLEYIKAINMIQKHYNIQRFIKEVNKDSFMKLNKKKMNDLIKISINIKNNEDDKVETEIIRSLSRIFDELKDKNEIEVYLIIFYAYWCQYYQEEHKSSYDMYDNYLNYPVFKEWKDRIKSIIETDKNIRDYFLNYTKDEKQEIDDTTLQFFNDVINIKEEEEKRIEYIKNKLIHQEKYKEFIKNQIAYLCDKKINGGKITKNKSKNKQITIDGKTFESIKAATESLSVSRSTLYRKLKQ